MEEPPTMHSAFVVVFWILFLACLVASRVGRHKVFWPLLALGLVLLFNQVWTPGFFHIEVRDHHLYGTPIDILNHGAKVMLLALGMTLVIATGGVDLSDLGAAYVISGQVQIHSERFLVCISSKCKHIPNTRLVGLGFRVTSSTLQIALPATIISLDDRRKKPFQRVFQGFGPQVFGMYLQLGVRNVSASGLLAHSPKEPGGFLMGG